MPPAILTITVAIIGVIGTLGGIWWRNRHEHRMKLLEIQLKQEEREHAALSDLSKRKREAAETIIKKWSYALEEWNMRENFYAGVTDHNWQEDRLKSVTERQRKGLEALEKKAEKADMNGPDLYHMYFSRDLSNIPNAEEKRADLEGLWYIHWELNQSMRTYLAKAEEIIQQSINITDPAEKERATSEVDEVMSHVFEKAKLLRENCRIHIEVLRTACRSIQTEIDAL